MVESLWIGEPHSKTKLKKLEQLSVIFDVRVPRQICPYEGTNTINSISKKVL